MRNSDTLSHKGPIRSARFSLNGNYIAIASSDSTAKIYHVATQKKVATVKSKKPIFKVNFSPSHDEFTVATADGTAKVVNLKTGKVSFTIKHKDKCVES